MFFYNKLVRNVLLPLGDLVTRQRVMRCYHFYSQAQWWDRERVHHIQNKNLRYTIQTAYHDVPFYKELYDQHKLNVHHITCVNDLPKLPMITKEMLRNAYPHACTRPTGWPYQEFCTSGSSGQPFAVRIDNLTLSHARSLMLLRANFSGWEIGDSLLQMGMSLERGIVRYFKDKLLRTEYVSAFDLSNSILDKYIQIIDRNNIDHIMGYPGSIYYLAKRANELGYEKRMKGVVTWGDNLYKHYRRIIETQFGCVVTDTYGCGEGIQVAAQCEYGFYHIFMPHVAVEIVDDLGTSVPDGEIGNILLTRLDPGAMPLIRYQIGDIGRKLPSNECSCGRGLEMLASIDGRDTDVVLTPRGNRLIVHFFTGIFEYYGSIDTFQITQVALDEILVEIVPRKDFLMEHWESIKQEILLKGDSLLKINMVLVDKISLPSSNKRRFIVSKINKV